MPKLREIFGPLLSGFSAGMGKSILERRSAEEEVNRQKRLFMELDPLKRKSELEFERQKAAITKPKFHFKDDPTEIIVIDEATGKEVNRIKKSYHPEPPGGPPGATTPAMRETMPNVSQILETPQEPPGGPFLRPMPIPPIGTPSDVEPAGSLPATVREAAPAAKQYLETTKWNYDRNKWDTTYREVEPKEPPRPLVVTRPTGTEFRDPRDPTKLLGRAAGDPTPDVIPDNLARDVAAGAVSEQTLPSGTVLTKEMAQNIVQSRGLHAGKVLADPSSPEAVANDLFVEGKISGSDYTKVSPQEKKLIHAESQKRKLEVAGARARTVGKEGAIGDIEGKLHPVQPPSVSAGTMPGAAAVTAARQEAKNITETLQGADRAKYQMLTSAERQAGLVQELYRPEFVGKGFAPFVGGLKVEFDRHAAAARKGQYVSGAIGGIIPGGIAGAIREYIGNISPEEVRFRRSIVDVADTILRARSGAQINEQEFHRMIGMLIKVTDEPAVFVPSVERFIQEVGGMKSDIARLASTPAARLGGTPKPKGPPSGKPDYDARGNWIPR